MRGVLDVPSPNGVGCGPWTRWPDLPHDEEGQDRSAIDGGLRRVDGLRRDKEITTKRAVSVGEVVGVGIRPAMP